MTPIEQLQSVLCDPTGKCCIAGSEEDRAIIDRALRALAEQPAQQKTVNLRRGDLLRCIETDELCTVWATSPTGNTLIKWSANNFGNYTAEQIGELFWLEPAPVQQCRACFGMGYVDGKGDKCLTCDGIGDQPAQHKPVGLRDAVVVNLLREGINKHRARELADHLISLTPPPPQRKPLTDEQIRQCFRDLHEKKENWLAYARAIEAAHNIKEHTCRPL